MKTDGVRATTLEKEPDPNTEETVMRGEKTNFTFMIRKVITIRIPLKIAIVIQSARCTPYLNGKTPITIITKKGSTTNDEEKSMEVRRLYKTKNTQKD